MYYLAATQQSCYEKKCEFLPHFTKEMKKKVHWTDLWNCITVNIWSKHQ